MNIDDFTSFEIFRTPSRLVNPSSWVGHIPFAQWLVSTIKPSVYVELGVHTGNSYCAICESVQRSSINCQAYGVDTWLGDQQASFYPEDIYQDLWDYTNNNLSGVSNLVRATFADAVSKFEDCSIDLLHTDGLHTYDAVKNDYLTWLPKMSKRGVILFHDTQVKRKDFGVWKLWSEVKEIYPSFEFEHSHGLGVLLIGKNQPEKLVGLCNTKNDEKTAVRLIYSTLGERLENILWISSNRVKLDCLKAANPALELDNYKLKKSLGKITFEYNEMKKSLSWTLTSPLRRVRDFFDE